MAKIGLAYDLFTMDCLQGSPLDCTAELDSQETILSVAGALRAGGHEVILLEANESFPEKLKESHPEMVFNIAEGRQGNCRESHIPAICEFYGIPYTGSDVLTLSMCLNKAITNQLLSSNRVHVPPSQVFMSSDDIPQLENEFPLIVKLLHEGSSMGLSRKSVVHDEQALRDQVDFVISTYHQPALVQKYILGREFTVGILGNRNSYTLPITEVIFNDPYDIVTFVPDDEVLPMIRATCGEQCVRDLQSQCIPHHAVCPADLSPELTELISQTALKAFKVMGCRDWCRVDFRLGRNNRLYVLELNPIAGIGPGYWLPNSAAVVNLDYTAFINAILDVAWERVYFNQPEPLVPIQQEACTEFRSSD